MTLTSTDFSSTGFTHTNVLLSATLQFSTPLVNSTSSWLEHKVDIMHKTPPDTYGPGFVKAVLADLRLVQAPVIPHSHKFVSSFAPTFFPSIVPSHFFPSIGPTNAQADTMIHVALSNASIVSSTTVSTLGDSPMGYIGLGKPAVAEEERLRS